MMNYKADIMIRKYRIPTRISVNILIILTVDFNFNCNQLSPPFAQDMGVEKTLMEIIASRFSSSFEQVAEGSVKRDD